MAGASVNERPEVSRVSGGQPTEGSNTAEGPDMPTGAQVVCKKGSNGPVT